MGSSDKLRNAMRYLGSRRYRLECKLVRDVMAQISEDGLQALREKYDNVAVDGWDYTKYLDIERHMGRAARQATTVGLHKAAPSRILDLGCGSGYFLAIARHMGHDVLGLDMPDYEMFDDTLALLNVPRVDHVIRAYNPLPNFDRRFDVITGHQVWFNWTGRKEPWSADEWAYFLDDCRSQLAPEGRMRFELNPGRNEEDRYLSEETAEALCRYPGAMLSDDRRVLTVAA